MWKRFPIVWLLTAVLAGTDLLGQQGRGVLYGTITDASGAGIGGVKVTITGVDTNIATVAVTQENGEYATPEIAIGNYRVSVDQTGFKSVQQTGINLQVGQRAEINIQLQVGSLEEKVEVKADAALINTTDATLGNVIENKRISELPLNGRNALALVLLAPNVKSQVGANNSGFGDRGVALTAISINGGPSSINSFLLDGGNNNQAFLQDLNVNPTVDAIQEFKVQSGVMPAEFGFTLGGVVNIATKSGTNEIHGTAYEFLRNNALDARNAFSQRITPYRYNQYGGAIGGPIRIPKLYDGRNKTFFFFNIEEWQYKYENNLFATVPTAQQRLGDLSQLRTNTGALIPVYDPATTRPNPNGAGFVRTPFLNNVIPTSRLDPVAQNYLRLVPLPNTAPNNVFTNANNYIAYSPAKLSMRQYLAKIDHRFSDKNSIFGRFMFYNHKNDNGGGNIYTDPRLQFRYDNYESTNVIIGDTHSFTPTLFNDFRINLARNYLPFQAASYLTGIASELGLPSNVPDLQLPIFNAGLPAPADQNIGLRGQTTWQLVDSLTYITGAHTIKIGFEGRMHQANQFQRIGLSGTYNFAGALTGNPLVPSGTGSQLSTFLLGSVSSGSINSYNGESEKGMSFSEFIQDDWRITPRFTLNLGLRHDYQTWPRERNNGLSNFDPNAINPLTGLPGKVIYAGQDFEGSPHGPAPIFAFGPRVGFAYDLSGKGTTVIRGGYGIYYQNIFYRDFFGNTAGFGSITTNYNPPGNNTNFQAFQLSSGLPSPPIQPRGRALGPSAFLGQGVNYDEGGTRTPTSQQWNFSVQHQLPGQWVLEAAYSANHTTHLLSAGYDLNQLDPRYLSLGNQLQNNVPNPYPGVAPGGLGASQIQLTQALRRFPYYTSVNVRNPALGNSIYHSAFVSVQKRFSSGLVLLASYTKAKLISDSVSTPINFNVDSSVNVNGYQAGAYNRRTERSIDATDVAQRFTFSGVYEVPVGRGRHFDLQNPILNGVLGGWQTQGILTLQGGTPIAVTGASNFTASRPNATGVSAKVDNPNRDLWFNPAAFVNPPNYTFGNLSKTLPDVRGPGTVNVDLSLIKNIRLWERFSLQFRAESFNVANHVNLGMPNSSFVPGLNGLNTSSTFGVITSAKPPRINQFGLKVIF